ncbi:MAG: pyruvate kinase [Promethearchaeota archaeon]
MDIFVTIDPIATFLPRISAVEEIKGFRFNTGAALGLEPMEALLFFKQKIPGKKFWVDLKCREVKLVNKTVITPERRMLQVSHEIEGNVPFALYYNEGSKYLMIDKIMNGNSLRVLLPGNIPPNFRIEFGKGSSFNIPDATIKGPFLNDNDRQYIEAAKKLGIHEYCLSFVERASDIEEVLSIDPKANIIAKIESKKGISFVEKEYATFSNDVRLMAARGDLYIELDRPHQILDALKTIINADSNAIAASRLLQSLLDRSIPSCADICDVGFLRALGYNNFLLGDYICASEEMIKIAIGIISAIKDDFTP